MFPKFITLCFDRSSDERKLPTKLPGNIPLSAKGIEEIVNMDVERSPPAYTNIRRQVLRDIKKGREKVGENNDKWSGGSGKEERTLPT